MGNGSNGAAIVRLFCILAYAKNGRAFRAAFCSSNPLSSALILSQQNEISSLEPAASSPVFSVEWESYQVMLT